MKSITILALDNSLLSGIVGPLEIFAIADRLYGQEMFSPLNIVSIADSSAISFSNITIPVTGTLDDFSNKDPDKTFSDIIIIPPVFAELDALLENTLLIRWLREQVVAGAIIATVCAGSFLLAETGCISGKVATTHWQLINKFRNRYPHVDLQPDRMLVDGGSYICAGGAMAWQDLSLHIVARFISKEVASSCAKTLVMDGTRHVQTPYFMFDTGTKQTKDSLLVTDSAIDSVLMWLQENYTEGITAGQLAQKSALGERTFLRRFKKATGLTPMGYLQQLRVEAARHYLEVSNKNIEEVTLIVGYEDVSSFRRLFKEKTGLTPREYRQRFNRLV
ncbi:MAG: GlxA family transcriptional regulator [Desulfovibrio sp.]